ncbi:MULTISPECIES: hypothetical protein [unclassified Bacillus (in: firmicutes)]|uniref:hypothetical protein n=1 Tax=unclassified Bacillus (in: firmicutes) TaxID=185979 RepID=UPI0011138B9F|nr:MULTISPECIES: hypothetical protein [unclassified Bacillus (in: firmicutes)]
MMKLIQRDMMKTNLVLIETIKTVLVVIVQLKTILKIKMMNIGNEKRLKMMPIIIVRMVVRVGK